MERFTGTDTASVELFFIIFTSGIETFVIPWDQLLYLLLTMLAQMVACLPLVQQVQGSIPSGVVNINLKIFNLRARRGGDVHFLIARLYITALDYIPNPSAVCMLRGHIVLLTAILLSDGDVKPGGPLDAFREEHAMSRHRVSPSPFLSSSSHTTQLHYTNS